MSNTKIRFNLYFKEFQKLSDKASDEFIKSFKFEYESPEWKICRAKRDLYMREALENLDNANKYIKE